ncbi:MAG TPA: hypothetical protein VHQ65_06885 [Thermoanaerobaculia bacterium]|nr:hypothetical protein [Thermoanaerobaculia bacterium]
MKRFDPGAPIELSPRAGGPGLGRVLLFGCAGLLVLLGIGAVVFVLKADDFLGWVFGSFQQSVEARLPPDLPASQRQRLDRAFDAAIEDILTGEADPAAMQRLQQELLEMTTTAEGETLTREQVAAVTLALEEVAGIEPTGEPRQPAPRPAPAPGQPPPGGSPSTDAPPST